MAQTKIQTVPTAADEAALLARLRAGDERAFEALVERHYGTMLAVARGYVKSRAVADEVVQEAWLGVLKGLDPDRFRGQQDAFPGHWRQYPSDWEVLPEESLLGRETLDLVMRVVSELPPAQRQVITLRDISGFSADEVCAALDVSAGNQRVLLHRARSRVRAALEGHLDG